MLKVNVLVLNYNGKDLLEECLPSVIEAKRRSAHSCRVTVIDNNSSDNSPAFVRENFKDAELVELKDNKVLCSYNDVVKSLDDEIVILLNNDIKVSGGFVDAMVSGFMKGDGVFFVASNGDRSVCAIRWGLITADITYRGCEERMGQEGYAFSAGIAAFDRKKFLELGGYDDMYLPGRYEDVDLCFRGWKRGWKGLYAPAALKEHLGGRSFARSYSWQRTQAIVFRNGILFMAKNVSDLGLLANFIFSLILRLGYFTVSGKWFLIVGFFEAVKRLPVAIRKRKSAQKNAVLKDRDILDLLNGKVTTEKS